MADSEQIPWGERPEYKTIAACPGVREDDLSALCAWVWREARVDVARVGHLLCDVLDEIECAGKEGRPIEFLPREVMAFRAAVAAPW